MSPFAPSTAAAVASDATAAQHEIAGIRRELSDLKRDIERDAAAVSARLECLQLALAQSANIGIPMTTLDVMAIAEVFADFVLTGQSLVPTTGVDWSAVDSGGAPEGGTAPTATQAAADAVSQTGVAGLSRPWGL